jgi:hypothetical protein
MKTLLTIVDLVAEKANVFYNKARSLVALRDNKPAAAWQ